VEIQLTFEPRLHLFVGPAQRTAEASVRCDGVSTLGHVVESLGVPLTEVGALDTAYENPDVGDAALAARSAAEERIMLSRDRGLLHRRELFAGAYIYSHRPAEQLDEVLIRFAPPLAPWTRCTACNGELREVSKENVSERLPTGTQRTYKSFAECTECGHAYWRGAHAGHLDEIVQHALEQVRR